MGFLSRFARNRQEEPEQERSSPPYYRVSEVEWRFWPPENGRTVPEGSNECAARLHIHPGQEYQNNEDSMRWLIENLKAKLPATLSGFEVYPYKVDENRGGVELVLPLGHATHKEIKGYTAEIGTIPEQWRERATAFRDTLVNAFALPPVRVPLQSAETERGAA